MPLGFTGWFSLLRPRRLPSARRGRAPLSLLSLEDRTLLTASVNLSAGNLTVTLAGSPPGSDQLQITELNGAIEVADNGAIVGQGFFLPANRVTSITVTDN